MLHKSINSNDCFFLLLACDKLFKETRDLNFEVGVQVLRQKATTMKEDYTEINSTQTVSELKDFVKKLINSLPEMTRHIHLEHVIALNNLEKAGLLKKQEFKSNWQTVKRTLKLIIVEDTDTSRISRSKNSLIGNKESRQRLVFQQDPENSYAPSVQLGSSQVPVFSTQYNDDASFGGETPANTAGDTAAERKERNKWIPTDDLLLISAWLNTSKDPVVCNEQKSAAFWKRVAEYYAESANKVSGRVIREPNQCKNRWQKINDIVSKFSGAFDFQIKL